MGAIFKIPAIIVYVLGGVWGLLVCLGILSTQFGVVGGVVAFFLFPITVYIAPWYAAIAHGNWFPLLLIYGSGLGAAVLMAIGNAIGRE